MSCNVTKLWHAGWPDYPYAALIAVVTVIMVLILEHLVSAFYGRRMRLEILNAVEVHGEAAVS